MEQLSKYLNSQNMKPSAFAKKLNVAPSTVLRLISGDRAPSLSMARKIEVATGGKIKAAAIWNDRLRSAGKSAA